MKLSKAILYTTLVVLLAEASFEFVWKYRSFFMNVGLIIIAALIIYSVASSNRKAKQ